MLQNVKLTSIGNITQQKFYYTVTNDPVGKLPKASVLSEKESTANEFALVATHCRNLCDRYKHTHTCI